MSVAKKNPVHGFPHPLSANDVLAPTEDTGVILGLVPRIQLSASAGAGGWLDGRDKPDHDKLGINEH
jgi:hypothetical protein